MAERDHAAGLQKRGRGVVEDAAADERMPPHDDPLGAIEARGFAEYRVRHRDLPYVVHAAGVEDELHFSRALEASRHTAVFVMRDGPRRTWSFYSAQSRALDVSSCAGRRASGPAICSREPHSVVSFFDKRLEMTVLRRSASCAFFLQQQRGSTRFRSVARLRDEIMAPPRRP